MLNIHTTHKLTFSTNYLVVFHNYKCIHRFAGRLRNVAELKVTQANIIGHDTIHHCSLEFNYEQVVVTNSSTSPSTYLQISVLYYNMGMYAVCILTYKCTHTHTHERTPYLQTGTAEQFEQVLFNVRPMRLTLKIYDTLRWCRTHPGLTSLTLALPTAALGAVIALKILTR